VACSISKLGQPGHRSIVTLSARPETDQADRDIIQASRPIHGVAAAQDQLGPADDRLHISAS
jgi:hypothetical protein